MRQRVLGILQLEHLSQSATLYMALSLINGVLNYAFIWLSSIYLGASDFVEFHQWIANVSVIFLSGLLTFNYGILNSRRSIQSVEIIAIVLFSTLLCAINEQVFPTHTPIFWLIVSALGNAFFGYLSGRCFAEGRLLAVSLIQSTASLAKIGAPLVLGRSSPETYEYAYLGQMLVLALSMSVVYLRSRSVSTPTTHRENPERSLLHPTLLSISQYLLPNVALLLLGSVRYEMPWSASVLLLYLRGGSFVMILFGQLSLSSGLSWSKRSRWSGLLFSLLLYGGCFSVFVLHLVITRKFEPQHVWTWCFILISQVCFGASQLYLFKKEYSRFAQLMFLGIAGLVTLALS